jgi:class 3 adenylate cyclase
MVQERPVRVERSLSVRAALQFQARVRELTIDDVADRRIAFRVGINIGDVIVEPQDIFGDGVRASRASPSLSESSYQQVRDKLDIRFVDMGEQHLKNIARPIRVYRLQAQRAAANLAPSLTLPDKPSIAVLPFQNMSGDPDQDYFADGVVEEITTALSRIR